jgi:DNA uptake protein ComE-like DNA-binding protein
MKNRFHLSLQTKKGIVGLISILILFTFLPRILMSFKDNNFYVSSTDVEEFKKEVKHYSKKRYQSSYRKNKKVYNVPPLAFDPNNYQLQDWVALGLSEKQANVILKFSKYGIKSDDELRNIFVISPELFAIIKDSTFYAEIKYPSFEEKKYSKVEKQKIRVELNAANQETLETIPGVGPYFAKKIITFRDKLGGYIGKEQLLEINKMTSDKLLAVQEFISFDQELIRQININEASAEELSMHPYISWNVANVIVKYREQHGSYVSLNEILKTRIIDNELFLKLKPYLTF